MAKSPGCLVFTESLINLKAGDKPEVSALERSFCSSTAPSRVQPARGPELRLNLGLGESALPLRVEGEAARAELGCLASGAGVGRRMLGNKSEEVMKNPRLVVNIKNIHVKVLGLKVYPGKQSLTQKSGSLGRAAWSRRRALQSSLMKVF